MAKVIDRGAMATSTRIVRRRNQVEPGHTPPKSYIVLSYLIIEPRASGGGDDVAKAKTPQQPKAPPPKVLDLYLYIVLMPIHVMGCRHGIASEAFWISSSAYRLFYRNKILYCSMLFVAFA